MSTPSQDTSKRLLPAARFYIGAVAAAGLGAAALTLLRGGLDSNLEFIILCALAILLGSRTVRLWSTVEMSVALPFIYAALLQFGAPQAVFVSLLAALGASLMRKKRLNLPRVVFNTSVITGTTAAASWVYLWMGGQIGTVHVADSFWPLLGSTIVYYALNTGLISGVIHLTQGMPFARVWKENFVWSAPSYFTGSSIGLMIVLLVNRYGLMAFGLALPPSILIYFFFRMYMERMEMQRLQLEQFESMNRELEIKVEERTRELKSVNRKLEDSNRQLQTSNRLKSQFLANVSHELRTPLNAIIGFSELLLNDARHPLSAEQQESTQDIHSSGRHLLDLINDILDLSKIEAGKMDLSLEEIRIEEIVEAALAMIKPIAVTKRIDLGFTAPPDLPLLKADPGKVKQVLYNLLSNAVKFTHEEGRVGVGLALCGEMIEISVVDTGIGIAREDQERIFSEFLQLDGTYARRYQGTGLGLTLVKRFIEMHNGRIWVESQPGLGSRFTFLLPREGPAESSGVHHAPHEGSGERLSRPTGTEAGRTILVVEDNPLNAKLVRRVLEGIGHRVMEVHSAREALDVARRACPDLILMDLQLPDMDGLDVTRCLKADPATRGIPTVALTAHAMKGDDERARSAGCCGYITKPIDVARFPAMVEGFLKEGATR